MSVRRVTRSSRSIIGTFPSLKNGGPVAYESTIERDLLYFLEHDSTVRRYTMQPMVIEGVGPDGELHRYIPDVLVEHMTSQSLIECKPAAKQHDRHTQQQIALGEQWADRNRCDFVLITDVDLRTGHRLANLKLLWRYARLPVPLAVTERCRKALVASTEGMLFEVLLASLDGTAPPLTLAPCLYSLLFQHILVTDLDLPLTSSSLLRHVAAVQQL